MKRLIFVIAFLIGVASINAQDAINEVGLRTAYTFTGTDAFGDTLTDTGTITRYFNVNRTDAYYYLFEVTMDETSGTSGCHVQWAGSLLGTNFTNIGSADTLTADGSVFESSTSTPLMYKFLRCVVTGYGTTTWDLDYIGLKITGIKND